MGTCFASLPLIGPFINCDEWHATREGPSCSSAKGANLPLSSSLRLVPLLPYDSFLSFPTTRSISNDNHLRSKGYLQHQQLHVKKAAAENFNPPPPPPPQYCPHAFSPAPFKLIMSPPRVPSLHLPPPHRRPRRRRGVLSEAQVRGQRKPAH